MGNGGKVNIKRGLSRLLIVFCGLGLLSGFLIMTLLNNEAMGFAVMAMGFFSGVVWIVFKSVEWVVVGFQK